MAINSFKGEYSFLSNFYKSSILYQNISYPTVEHFYQAMKTEDALVRKMIAGIQNPAEVKKVGKTISSRERWEEMKLPIMKYALSKKFTFPYGLGLDLLRTGEQELVEGNYWGDTFWGVDHRRGGENHLGKLLMQVRQELRNHLKKPKQPSELLGQLKNRNIVCFKKGAELLTPPQSIYNFHFDAAREEDLYALGHYEFLDDLIVLVTIEKNR